MEPELERMLAEVLAGGDPVGASLVARSRTTAVFRASLESGASVYVKRYEFPTFRDRLRGMFRGTLFGRDKASAEADCLKRMKEAGVAVPRPLSWGARKGFLFLERCALITEGLEGTRTLMRFVADEPGLRRTAAEELGRFVSELHGKGFTDGSLAPRNILLKKGTEGVEVYKVDVGKCRRRTPPAIGIQDDLARLLAATEGVTTRSERMRFLRAYLGGGRLGNRARRWMAALERSKGRFDAREKPRIAEESAGS